MVNSQPVQITRQHSALRFVLPVLLVILACLTAPMYGDYDAQWEQAQQQHRLNYGYWDVVEMNALVTDFKNGTITEAEFVGQLWEDQPVLTAALYARHTEVNDCFTTDLVVLQADPPIRYDNGVPAWFDTAQFLDGSGHVLPGQQAAYNSARRANTILVQKYAYIAQNCLEGCGTGAEDRCCSSDAIPDCATPKVGARCLITLQNNCADGCIMCGGN